MAKRSLLILALLLASVASAQTSPTLSWYWTAPTQFTDGSAIPSTDTITYNVLLGTAGPGSESATPVQSGDRYTSAATTGAYTAGMNVCVEIIAVDSAANTIPSEPSAEFCQTYEPPEKQVSPPANVTNQPPSAARASKIVPAPLAEDGKSRIVPIDATLPSCIESTDPPGAC
jgi:hypothetical protein